MRVDNNTVSLTKGENVIFRLVCESSPQGISPADLLALAIHWPGNKNVKTIYTNIYTINKKLGNLKDRGPYIFFDRGKHVYKINGKYAASIIQSEYLSHCDATADGLGL